MLGRLAVTIGAFSLILTTAKKKISHEEIKELCTKHSKSLPNLDNLVCCRPYLVIRCYLKTCLRIGYTKKLCGKNAWIYWDVNEAIRPCGINKTNFSTKCSKFDIQALDNPDVATKPTESIVITTLSSFKSATAIKSNEAAMASKKTIVLSAGIAAGVALFVILVFIFMVSYKGSKSEGKKLITKVSSAHQSKVKKSQSQTKAEMGKQKFGQNFIGKRSQEGRLKQSETSVVSKTKMSLLSVPRSNSTYKSRSKQILTGGKKSSMLLAVNSFDSRAELAGAYGLTTEGYGIARGSQINAEKLRKAVS